MFTALHGTLCAPCNAASLAGTLCVQSTNNTFVLVYCHVVHIYTGKHTLHQPEPCSTVGYPPSSPLPSFVAPGNSDNNTLISKQVTNQILVGIGSPPIPPNLATEWFDQTWRRGGEKGRGLGCMKEMKTEISCHHTIGHMEFTTSFLFFPHKTSALSSFDE